MTGLIDLAGLGTAELRQRLAECRITIRDARGTIDTEELAERERLLREAGGNVKDLGSNEQLREDRYRSAYARNDVWIRAKARLIEATDDAEMIGAILDGRADLAEEKRREADDRRTAAVNRWLDVAERNAGVNGTVTAGALA